MKKTKKTKVIEKKPKVLDPISQNTLDDLYFLTDIEYLKWKNSVLEVKIAEMTLKELKSHLKGLSEQFNELQFKINNIINSDGPETIKGKQRVISDKKQEHLNVIAEVEKRVGYSLADCAIDDLTMEIKKI